MATFLVFRQLQCLTRDQYAAAPQEASEAARQASVRGHAVHHLGGFFIPAEDGPSVSSALIRARASRQCTNEQEAIHRNPRSNRTATQGWSVSIRGLRRRSQGRIRRSITDLVRPSVSPDRSRLRSFLLIFESSSVGAADQLNEHTGVAVRRIVEAITIGGKQAEWPGFSHRLHGSQYQRIGGGNKPILAWRQTTLLMMRRHRGFSAGIVHWVCPRGD